MTLTDSQYAARRAVSERLAVEVMGGTKEDRQEFFDDAGAAVRLAEAYWRSPRGHQVYIATCALRRDDLLWRTDIPDAHTPRTNNVWAAEYPFAEAVTRAVCEAMGINTEGL